ncbi:hypothetical protein F2Q70_00029976 [Brassica cretica]|uniref:Retrotransposon gag domain-containing protein n=1 Tax=Brassica cretica TaxID=69181 RepID=A0A8S9FDN3_BRACR|nr:hypothetical protein F2Q70_00029976 [Brassica cretica]
MKRGFMGSSKKEPADSRTIRKQHCSPQHCSWQYCSSSVDQHCHPVSIDTVHPASIDTVNPALSDTVHSALIDTVHPASIDTVHHASIDTVHHASIDTVHPASTDFVHPDTVHRDTVCCDTVQTDTVHPMKNDTTCGETGKIEVLILKVDENGMLRDEEGCTRNSAVKLINAQGVVIPDVIVVAELNDFNLSREWYDWVGQDPFKGLPHQDPRNHNEELKDLVSRSEQNEVSEYHMLCKIFPYSISGDAFSWFSQLQPGSLTSWENNDKWDWFLASLDEEYMVPIQLLDDIMAKRDEQHVSGELSRVEEAGTE